MSFLIKMFAGEKEGKPSSIGDAIQKLRETKDMLIKKQDFLEKKIEEQISIARKNGTKNKRAAIQPLKRKRPYKKQPQQIDGTLSTIEMRREALEGVNTNAVRQVMKNAADALKAAHQHMNVELHKVMDDIAEQRDIAKEISEAISKPFAFGEDVDEDELERELEELEQEGLHKELLGVGPSVDELPSIPTTDIVKPTPTKSKPVESQTEEEEEDVMKQLQQLSQYI